MAITAPRNVTGRDALQPGEYTIEDDAVLYRCKRCGCVDALNGHDMAPDGKVTPPWVCSSATCSGSAWLVLEAWGEP